MHFSHIDSNIPVKRYKDSFIGSKIISDETIVFVLSSKDFSIIRNDRINEAVFFVSVLGAKAILYHFTKPEYFFQYQLETGVIEKVNSQYVNEYVWDNDLILKLDRINSCYAVFNSNEKLINRFQTETGVGYRWYDCGIARVKRFQKENNWIECIDPIDNSVKWRVDFQWQISRLETYDNLIVLEYHAYDKIRTHKGYEGERDWYNPDRYTIVLDGDTGEEIWRYPNGYHQIDYEKGVVLTGKVESMLSDGRIETLSAIEIELHSGKIFTDVEVEPTIQEGFQCSFVDAEGIYYTSYDGSFGKISKTDGAVLWEFDLIDNKGEKRKLSDWLLLGNGNLVLQAMPNHPNGDLTCVFNPKENLQYSKVKDGRRISSDYA